MKEDLKGAYEVEWQNFRYQDALRWSRFRVMAVIEGAYLTALYATDLDATRGLFLAVFVAVIVLLLSLLAVNDQREAQAHLERALLIEKTLDAPLPDYPLSKLAVRMRGTMLMAVALVVINVWNVIVILDQVYYLMGDFANEVESYI